MRASVGDSLATGAGGLIDLEAAFLLHSNPGSQNIIFLDFDGHLTRATYWNDDPNSEEDIPIPNIVTPPYSTDADGTFTDAELQLIQNIWERVSEDYRPFDVDVTTEDPGIDVIAMQGIRVLIGGSTNDWFSPPRDPAGGVALLNSFAGGADVGTFIFSGDAGGNPKFTTEAISHEVGHTVGLIHDGQVIPGEEDPLEYYPGHGPGLGFPTGWAPIMGVGYGQELTQWSSGEYPNANNLEDDLAIITMLLPYRADDHGDTYRDASALTYTGTSFFGEGIIEENTDVDFFSFTLGIEEVTLDITPFQSGPNLDILASLHDSSGEVIATSNFRDDLNASFTINVDGGLQLTPGNYFISIDGVGKPFTTDAGYSDYGSLGYYSISGARKSLLELLVGVDFDVPKSLGGQSPQNWTLYSGGVGPAVLSDLPNESGFTTPINLSIHSTSGLINSYSNTIDIDTIPFHPEPLDNLDGFLEDTGATWTFTWSDLAPLTVYEVYVFGLTDEDGGNTVQIVGDGEPITFDQTLPSNDLVVNSEAGSRLRQLVEYAKTLASSDTGTITITVTTDEGASAAALAGLALRPGTMGSLRGQKWNDVDGNGIKDLAEAGLPGWTIFLDENGNGQLDASFQQTVNSVDVPQVINDYTSVKSELFFEGVRSVFDVNVTLDISHTFVGDLNAYLISPLGTRVELFSDVGIPTFGDNFQNTTLDDEAATSITIASPPFTGAFRPEGLLSAFDGEDANGIWTLEIKDDAGTDNGVLNSWSVTITGSEPSTVTDALGEYRFDDLAPGVYRLAEVQQEGWAQTFAPPPVTVSSGARVQGADFGNWIPVIQTLPGSIGGQKYNDMNADGVKDAGEPGLGEWTIFIDGNDNGVLDLDATLTVDSTDVPLDITDFSTVTSDVFFDGLSSVLDVNLTLDITHSFVGDLDVYLISPSGRQVELFTGVGGQFNDFQNTTLDDQAENSILTATAPFSGTFRPEGLLGDFIGEDPNGSWKLLIRDTASADEGTLNSWSLTIVGTERSTTTDENGNYAFTDLLPNDYILREVQQAGWVQTSAPSSPITLNEEQQVSNADFGNAAILAGDYNRNNVVDTVDFLIWRKANGQNVAPFSGADGDGDGVVGPNDYEIWRANFGMTRSAPGAGSSLAAAAALETGSVSSSAAVIAAATPGAEPVALAASAETSSESGAGETEMASGVPAELSGTAIGRNSSSRIRPAVRSQLHSSVASNDMALLEWRARSSGRRTLRLSDERSLNEQSQPSEQDQLDALDSAFESLEALVAC